jgi:hypothetical protein
VPGDSTSVPEEGGVPPALRLDVFATVLRRQAADADELLGFLAERLARALPDAVRVSRRGPLGTGRVRGVRMVLPHVEFELRRGAAGTLEAFIGKAVGGVVLRHDPVALEDWINQLAGALEDVAAHSESSRYALRSIIS